MKILIVGDPHFRYQLPYATAIADGRKSEWEAVKSKIVDESKDCNLVILMGDNFNSKHNHSSVNAEFVDFLQQFGKTPIIMLVGNHERFGEETALDFLKKFQNPLWDVVSEPRLINFNGLDLQFIPYMTPGVLGVATVSEATQKVMEGIQDADYMFHHHIVESTKWGSGDSGIVNEIVLPSNIEERYKRVFGGHIHQPSKVTEKTQVVGNIFTNEVGEHEKFIYKLDTDSNTFEEIKLPVRGIYKVELLAGTKIPELPKNSIVKVTILDRTLQDSVDLIREKFGVYDSYVLVEQYSKKRTKVRLEEAGALDFSIGNLLKLYSEAKKIPLGGLTDAYNLIES